MKNEFLRHTLATIAYRFQKAINNAEATFGNFSAGKESRTPNEIIHHMYEVLSGTRFHITGETSVKKPLANLEWYSEIEQFHTELKKLDQVLEKEDIEINTTKRLLQGPFSDVLTHVGQIAMLRRLNGNPIQAENFYSASIPTGID